MRSKVSVEIEISDHAFIRTKERLGMDKRAARRIALKAYVAGKKHGACKGRLKSYLDQVYREYENCNNMRIWGEAIWLFAGNVLVTVYNIPHELKPLIKK
ncbi:MAG: hypothetical protein J0M30_14730 [Chitinophagales bacterium]|nr:hypothetical protein [Chitinophagales bacterium]